DRGLVDAEGNLVGIAGWQKYPDQKQKLACPKHSQWITLNREHAEILVEKAPQWRTSSWHHSPYMWNRAASDEWAPLCYLKNAIGEQRFNTEVSSLPNPYLYYCRAGC